MKRALILLQVILLYLLAPAQSTGGKEKLNVIIFLADDLGWKDLGYNGSSFYETPHLDSFSRVAQRFDDAYAACHVCSPTRASILTGRYPARIGLTDWLPGRTDFPFQKLKNVASVQHLPYDIKTLPEALKENGYATAIFGKWHLGEDSLSTFRQGFDVHIPDWNKGWPNGTYFSPYNMKGLEGGEKGEYLTDRLTTEALGFIRKNKDSPFFLYLSQFAVHDPVEGRPDLVEKYRKKLTGLSESPPESYRLEGNPDSSYRFSPEELEHMIQEPAYQGYKIFPNRLVKVKQSQDNPQFAAMVENLDENFGRVIATLQELGIADRTVIIFFSDNGGMSAANFFRPDRNIAAANLDKAFSTSNAPLRGGKGWLYEGGIREPLLIWWPGVTHPGSASSVPVISTDIYPTILDMLGIPLLPDAHPDGMSLAPLLKGKRKISRKALFWHFPHYSNHGMQSPGGAVRCGDYKLLEYFENNTVQLFNLKKDPGEEHDLSKVKPGKVRKLLRMLHTWRVRVGARMMETNPEYGEMHANN